MQNRLLSAKYWRGNEMSAMLLTAAFLLKTIINQCWFPSMELNSCINKTIWKNCSATEIAFVTKQFFVSIWSNVFSIQILWS